MARVFERGHPSYYSQAARYRVRRSARIIGVNLVYRDTCHAQGAGAAQLITYAAADIAETLMTDPNRTGIQL